MQITYEAIVYKAPHHNLAAIESGQEMPYVWQHETDNYARIGTAVVTVTLLPKNELQKRELDSLNEKLQAVRADNQRRENAILDQISKLSALTFVEA